MTYAMTTGAPSVQAADGRVQQAMAAVTEVWHRFKDLTIGRVAVLERACQALREGTCDEVLHRQAEREAHKLAGSLGTFGFTQGARLARETQRVLHSEKALDPGQISRLTDIVTSLRRELEHAATAQPPTQAAPDEDHRVLLVVDDDREFVRRLREEAHGSKICVVMSANPAAARQELAKKRPDAALLNLSFGGEAAGGFALLAELMQQTPPVPVIVLAEQDAFIDRVEVARLGGRGFLQKPLPPAQILDVVSQVLQHVYAAEAKVLAVDDDPQILATLRALLERQSLRLTTLDDPRRFWAVLHETSPDLLIFDVDMPHVSGIELCRVVRSDPRWSGLPVLFLTACTDAEVVHKVFSAGADDFVTKPIVGPELVTRIVNRLERTRLLRHLAEVDVLTGLANRRKFTQELARFFRLSDRHKQPVGLAVLDLDHFKHVNDRYGHVTGDEVLSRLGKFLLQSFRSEDVVARWGGEEFVVGMYGMSRQNGVKRLTAVLEAFRRERFTGPAGERFEVSFSAGVAEYPEDGIELQTLYRAADRALYRAKTAGRALVLPAAACLGHELWGTPL
ncbi:MAG: diguanylate cyclase [Thermodesulfobacteriota bacterium]|jgi:diguanylate cyclase (GGDEF)-like protein